MSASERMLLIAAIAFGALWYTRRSESVTASNATMSTGTNAGAVTAPGEVVTGYICYNPITNVVAPCSGGSAVTPGSPVTFTPPAPPDPIEMPVTDDGSTGSEPWYHYDGGGPDFMNPAL